MPNLPAAQGARDERLLQRLLDTPLLPQVVPRLSPDVLHRVIQNCGLEDCAELVALATPGQLARVFDLDLWHSARAGLDEELDADRFGIWLEVLMESGPAVAAQKLAGMDDELVVAALATHVLVFDRAAVAPTVVDGEEMLDGRISKRTACEVGNYLIEAKRTDAWEAIVELLLFLDAGDPGYFNRLMLGCRNLSNAGFEVDGLDDLLADGEQVMFDLAAGRERRRDAQGYVAPAQARAFLLSARQVRLAEGTAPAGSAIADAYFRAMDTTPPDDATADGGLLALPPGPPAEETAAALAGVMHVLLDAGVLPQQPRALLGGTEEDTKRLALLDAHLQFALDAGEIVYSKRTAELAFLANALGAGCAIQGRPFTPREASDAAAAVCNLGLENWPAAWRDGKPLPGRFLVAQDLITVFQVGWTVLHTEVATFVAGRLIEVLRSLRCRDRDIQQGLDGLRREMTRQSRAGTPWLAREAMEVIMMLDTPAWVTLLGLIAECPVIPAAMNSSGASRVRAVSASAFEFISENSQIAAVRDFMQSLPDALSA